MRHIHIIGIGGTFMGSLAALAKESGFRVTGCDQHLYPPMSTQLENLGIEVHEGFDAQQLDDFPADVYVIGNVAKRGMEVIEAILNRKLPFISGPQWLSENILQQCRVLAVAGTHGKTTTSSMLAWVLEYAGLKPGFLIGGVPQNFAISARLPQHETAYFVIEADEYDTAFFDKRSKFVHYHPEVAILNNLEYDHADIFADLKAIQTQFHHLVRTIPSQGLLVVNHRSGSLKTVLEQGCWTPVTYFADEPSWHAENRTADGFDVFSGSLKVGHIQWDLSGIHNIHNALAVIAAVNHLGISPETACAALSSFANVKRRMEIKGVAKDVTVYDDFAHHPTAIQSTLEGLHFRQPETRIIAVLEPRSNTMKMGVMKDALPQSLQIAEHIFCYSGGLNWNVAQALQPLGDKVTVCDDIELLIQKIATFVQPHDAVVVMSNGGFQNIHQRILNQIQAA